MEPTVGAPPDRAGVPWREPVAVATGSVVGASARWAVAEVADVEAASNGAFPWHTFAVNVIGCLLIGLLAVRLTGAVGRAFAITGALGGFTTMSAFAVEANELVDAGSTSVAVVYVVASLAVGVGASWSGTRIGAVTWSRARSVERPR